MSPAEEGSDMGHPGAASRPRALSRCLELVLQRVQGLGFKI